MDVERISRLSHLLRKIKTRQTLNAIHPVWQFTRFRWMGSGIRHRQGMERSVSPSTGSYKYYTSALKILVLT